MSTRDPKRVTAGFISLEGGIDSGRSPNLIQTNQVSFAINTTFRGGFPTCRPGQKKIDLSFEDEDVQSDFEDGRFQGAEVYQADGGIAFIVASIGGKIFRVNVQTTNSVEDVSIDGDPNPTNRTQVWMTQAESWLIIQDGKSKALIFDGSGCRRANEINEVPTGTAMAYGQGRLWVARRREYLAGDIVGGPSGSANKDYKDAVLKFTEAATLNGGGAFAVPLQAGDITGMRFTAQLDTGLGQGELVVSTESAMFTNLAPPDRSTWNSLSTPIQRVAQVNFGSKGNDSLVNVNGDLWYRAKDGIRSLIMAVRNFQQGWGNTPLSKEVNRLIQRDDRNLLQYCSGVNFDNRLLMTVSPVSTAHGVYHRGLVALDFDIISSVTQTGSPAWEGLWTGIRILKLLKGDFGGLERCFAFVLNESNKIELWEITVNDRFDNDNERISWSIESGSYAFGDADQLKKLQTGSLYLDDVSGNVDIDVKYRPDQYPCWVDWHNWDECAKNSMCASDFTTSCQTIKNFKPQYRPKKRLPEPADSCDTVTKRPYRHGYEFQARISVTGQARIKRFLMHAHDVQETPTGECL